MKDGYGSRRVVALGALIALLCAFLPAAKASAQGQAEEHLRRQYLLDWAWEKVQEDAGKVVELTRILQAELKEDSLAGLPDGIGERIEALVRKAKELDEAVRSASKNQLSIKVITLAEDIEDEGKALEKVFKKLSPAWRRNKFRNLANDLRKKADSVKDRMRTP